MKSLSCLPFLLCLFFAERSLSQDIISLKDGSSLTVKVVEISSVEVKYKKSDNQQGPTYTIPRATVHKIKYQNGTLDNFVSGDPSFGLTVEDLVAVFKKRSSSNRLSSAPEVKEDINVERYGLKNPSANGIRVAGVDFKSGAIVSSKGRIDEIYVTKKLHFFDYIDTERLEKVEKDIFDNVTRINEEYRNREPENEILFKDDVNKLREYLILNYGSSFTTSTDGKETCWTINDDLSVCLYTAAEFGRQSLMGKYTPLFGGIDLTIKKSQKRLQLEQVELEKYTREVDNKKSNQINSIIGSTFVPNPSVNYDSLNRVGYYRPRMPGEKIRDPNMHNDLKVAYFIMDPVYKKNRYANLPDIVAVTRYLEKQGVYHQVASNSKIELVGNNDKYNIGNVAFTDGGFIFNDDGSFKDLFLIKKPTAESQSDKSLLKQELASLKAGYQKLIERKTSLGNGSLAIDSDIYNYDQYFLISGKTLLKQFPNINFEQFIPKSELLSVPLLLLVLPTKEYGEDEANIKYWKDLKRRYKH